MSEYNNLIASLRKKVGPLILEEILKLQELQTLPAGALGPGSPEQTIAEALTARAERVSIEMFGAAESNTAAQNDAALRDVIASATGTERLIIEIPSDRSYQFNDWFINKALITVDCKGELVGGTVHVGALPWNATQSDINAYPGGLANALTMNIRLRGLTVSGTPGAGRAGIKLAHVREVDIVRAEIVDCDYGIEGVGPNGDNYAHAVGSIRVFDPNIRGAITGIYLHKGTGNAVMHLSDWTIRSGHFTETDTSRCIRNIDIDGLDGLLLSGNYFFMSSNAEALAGKAENVRIVRSVNLSAMNNQCFESGTEAILIDRCKSWSIAGNVIAFPGQRVVSAGIRVTGGDNVGDIYCVGSVHGNTIEGASGHGIAIDAGCDYLSIGPNAMVALGSSSRHYGGGSPLGSNAYAVSRAAILANTRIAPQASSAKRIERAIDVTTTGSNLVIEIGDAKLVKMNPASQANIAAFTRFGVIPTDPEDWFIFETIASGGVQIFSGTAIKLVDGVHRNLTTDDAILFVPTGDGASWKMAASRIMDRSVAATTAGSNVDLDIKDGAVVLYTPASATTVASFNKNLLPLHQRSASYTIDLVCTNANVTLVHNATTMNCPGGANLVVPSGGIVTIKNRNGKVYVEPWNF